MGWGFGSSGSIYQPDVGKLMFGKKNYTKYILLLREQQEIRDAQKNVHYVNSGGSLIRILRLLRFI